MVPLSDSYIGEQTKSIYSNKTYRVNETANSIAGFVQGRDAVIQSIWLILNSQRYKHPIYSWDYGTQLNSLIGMPTDLVTIQLPRRVQEALKQDNRITGVQKFQFDKTEQHTLAVKFVVNTIYGQVNESLEVVI